MQAVQFGGVFRIYGQAEQHQAVFTALENRARQERVPLLLQSEEVAEGEEETSTPSTLIVIGKKDVDAYKRLAPLAAAFEKLALPLWEKLQQQTEQFNAERANIQQQLQRLLAKVARTPEPSPADSQAFERLQARFTQTYQERHLLLDSSGFSARFGNPAPLSPHFLKSAIEDKDTNLEVSLERAASSQRDFANSR